MTTLAWTYAAYLATSIGLTIWVARALQRNGTIVLTNGVEQRGEVASAVSELLVVGFYLLNLGAVCLWMRATGMTTSFDGAIELLSSKVGRVLLTLGIVHFLVLGLIGMVRGAARAAEQRTSHHGLRDFT